MEISPVTTAGRITAHKLYIAFAAVFGIAYLFVTGPFQVPDEYVHFYRAFDVAQGNLRAQVFPPKISADPSTKVSVVGGQIPASVHISAAAISGAVPFHPNNKFHPANIRSELERPLKPEETAIAEYYPSARLPAISYFPQAAGIALGRLFAPSSLHLLYFARAMNLLVALILSAIALRRFSPFGWTLTVIALSPISLFLAASASPDALTNAAALCCIVSFMILRDRPQVRTRSLYALLFAVIALLSGKILYAGILAIFATLLLRSNTPFRHRLAIFSTLCGGAGLTFLALQWTGYPLVGIPDTRIDASPVAQVTSMMKYPGHFFRVLWTTCYEFTAAWREQFVGILGWLDTPLPAVVHRCWAVALLSGVMLDVSFHSQSKQKTLDRWETSAIFVSVAIAFAGILAAVYAMYNPLNAAVITGVQGRYFIPLLFTASLVVYAVPKRRLGGQVLAKCVLIGALLGAHAFTIQRLIARYYRFD